MKKLIRKINEVFDKDDEIEGLYDKILRKMKSDHDRDQIRKWGYVKEPFDSEGDSSPSNVYDITDEVINDGNDQTQQWLESMVEYVADNAYNPVDHRDSVDFDKVASIVNELYTKLGITDKNELVKRVQQQLNSDVAAEAEYRSDALQDR